MWDNMYISVFLQHIGHSAIYSDSDSNHATDQKSAYDTVRTCYNSKKGFHVAINSSLYLPRLTLFGEWEQDRLAMYKSSVVTHLV